MTNTLIKRSNISYSPGSPGVAASPGSPAAPAFTGNQVQVVCSFRLLTPVAGGFGTGMVTSGSGVIASVGNNSYSYVCAPANVLVSTPARVAVAPTPGILPTPSQTFTDYRFGWNAAARSIASFVLNGYAQFQIPAAAQGVTAGLAPAGIVSGINIAYAFYVVRGIARIYENGYQRLYLGAYTPGAVFRIERRNGTVSYYIDGALVYTSQIPSTGTLFLDAALYAGGDYLDTPSIAATSPGGQASIALEALALKGGRATSSSGYSLRLQPLTVVGRVGTRSSASLQPITVRGGKANYGEAVIRLPALTVMGIQYDRPAAYSLGSLSLAPLGVAAAGKTGGMIQGNVALAPLQVLGGRLGYGESKVALAPLQVFGYAYEGSKNATIFAQTVASTLFSYFGNVEVQLISSFTAGTTFATLTIRSAAIAESAAVNATLTYSAVMQALMATQAKVFAGIPILTQDGEVWVVNDESGASSTYENYAFNSFGKFQGKYFGAKADGVYLLEGATDKGAPIRSMISLGKQDFGTTAQKTVPNCYIGLSSSGNVFLKVIANGTSYIYKTARSDSYLREQRVALGKGLRANYLTFELYNEAGADFELASVEFEVAALSRRI